MITIREELVLRVLSAFNKNGISEFTYNSIKNAVARDTARLALRSLESKQIIKKINENGFAMKYELYEIYDCPNFLFNPNITIQSKEYILELYKDKREYYSIKDLVDIWKCNEATARNRKYRIERYTNSNINDVIKNNFSVKKEIESDYPIIDTPVGKQFKTTIAKNEYYCEFCGTTDRDKFDVSIHNTCRYCHNEIKRKIEHHLSIIDYLYKRGSTSKTCKHTKEKFQLTRKDIAEILEHQNYKCYYTGVEFPDNAKDFTRLNKPSLDRIDSSIGYIKDNVVVCTHQCNVAKNSFSKQEFIEMCKKVANKF